MYIREWGRLKKYLRQELKNDAEFVYLRRISEKEPEIISCELDEKGIKWPIYDDQDYNRNIILKLSLVPNSSDSATVEQCKKAVEVALHNAGYSVSGPIVAYKRKDWRVEVQVEFVRDIAMNEVIYYEED